MEFYDRFENQNPADRETLIREKLVKQLTHAKTHSPYYRELLADIDPQTIDGQAGLAAVPVTRKSALHELQQKRPPFGGLATVEVGQAARVFQSPGPIYELEARRANYWRTARALFAAGFRRGQLIHNAFSYHFTPAGLMLETGASALECATFPAGTGQTELQVKALAEMRPDGYTGTPSFLKILLDKATEDGLDVSSIRHALVGGEALPNVLREAFAVRGIAVYQCYATAELGLIAYESSALEGLIVDEESVVEIVRPGTGDPLTPGEVGEVVVTTFNPEYPLIRFAIGDLSAILEGQSPCGRTNTRIKGWLGRADQTTKVRGMFVHPSQIAEVVKRHSAVSKARLVVDRADHQDIMTLHCEVGAARTQDQALRDALVQSIREVCKLRGEVALVAAGSLANDGKVIDDIRSVD